MKTAWLIFLVIALCLSAFFGCGKTAWNTGASQETLDTMAAFLDKEGFSADISNNLKELLEKYSYEGQKVSEIMFMELCGVGGGGTFANGDGYGYEAFSQLAEDSDRICDVFYTSRELEGLSLPFDICFEDSRYKVFQKIGITVDPEKDFIADKCAEGVMTLFANKQTKLTLHTAKGWGSAACYSMVPECDYMLQYEETHKVKKNGETVTVTRTLVLGFLEETGKLGYVEIAIEETRPIT